MTAVRVFDLSESEVRLGGDAIPHSLSERADDLMLSIHVTDLAALPDQEITVFLGEFMMRKADIDCQLASYDEGRLDPKYGSGWRKRASDARRYVIRTWNILQAEQDRRVKLAQMSTKASAHSQAEMFVHAASQRMRGNEFEATWAFARDLFPSDSAWTAPGANVDQDDDPKSDGPMAESLRGLRNKMRGTGR